MLPKQHDPLHGGSGPGLDDFAGGDKSGQSLPSTDHLRQAAERRLWRQHAVERVHRFCRRVLFEFVDELARHHPEIAGDIDRRLAAYAERLSPELLHAIGGDQFPVSPMRVVGGRQ
jgi:hypothetical protein